MERGAMGAGGAGGGRVAVLEVLLPGQPAHCPELHIESPIAAQNAWPNASSAHAKQFDGSPEHTGAWLALSGTEE